MFVTCYYDVYNSPDNFIKYMNLFNDLAISGLPFIVFTEPHFVDKFSSFPSSVKVYGIPLEEFELYNIAMKYDRELPSQRNLTKDTHKFLAVINAKVECVLKALELCDDDTFIWIDFGILKVINNREQIINKLLEINSKIYDKAYIPGCWSQRTVSTNSVHWRFCGGFFVIPRKHVSIFYKKCKSVLTDFCTLPNYKLCWEANVWAVVELFAEEKFIEWYHADHNDTIIMNMPSFNS